MHSLFFEIGLVIISAAAIAVLSHRFKQPLILAYIAAGILIGPIGFNLVQSMEVMHIMAQVGIMLMLFLVGLEMNPEKLKHLGPVALLAGGGQMLLTALFAYLLSLFFGFSWVQAAYLGLALGFSSTVIAVKVINDKKDHNTLYAQATISILLFQDFLAIVALFLLSSVHQGGEGQSLLDFLGVLGKGTLLIGLSLWGAKKILNSLYSQIATSSELMILFSLAWAFLVALISQRIGFGVEIGAFVAGVSLASLPYAFEISVKGRVIRDFFITIFFVTLGAGMVFSSIGSLVPQILVFSLLVLVGNPLMVLLLMNLMGYEKRTAFFSGLAIANISEFSLILMAMGHGAGYLDEATVSMMTMVAIVTMLLSSYGMTHNNWLYQKLKPILTRLQFKKTAKRLSGKKELMKDHIILIGCGQMGEQIVEQVRRFKEELLVVDHDAKVIEELIKRDIPCIFGDIEDEELLDELDLPHAELIISTISSTEDVSFLIRHVAKLPQDHRPMLIVTAETGREGVEFFKMGADYVILKPYLGAAHVYQINKNLYQLQEELSVKLPENFETSLKEVKFDQDHQYAHLLHGLNGMRLVELNRKAIQKGFKKRG